MMDKIDSYWFMFTRQISDRPKQAGFTTEEYKTLIRRIRDWCTQELRGDKR